MTIQKGFGFPEYSYQGASLPERQRGVPAAVPGLPAERCSLSQWGIETRH